MVNPVKTPKYSLLWGLFSVGQAVYHLMTQSGKKVPVVPVETTGTSSVPVSNIARETLPQLPTPREIAPLANSFVSHPKASTHPSLWHSFGLPFVAAGAGNAAVDAIGMAAEDAAGSAAASGAFSAARTAWGHVWSYAPSVAGIGVALTALYFLRKYWQSPSGITIHNNNTNTIRLEVPTGATIEKNGEVITVKNESQERLLESVTELLKELKAQRMAATAA